LLDQYKVFAEAVRVYSSRKDKALSYV
jgi:hypothetical protein